MAITKTDTNPTGATITFDERGHLYYTDPKTVLTSVTKFIGSFFPHFDAKTVSRAYARKHKLDAKDVRKKWKQKGAKASKLGTAVHNYCESQFTNEPFEGNHPSTERYENLLKTAKQACDKLGAQFEFLAAEKILFSERLGLAGQVDLLMRNPNNGNIAILDWKTNEKILTENFWRNAQAPICHLQDCNYVKYGLQLSTYKHLMLEEGYYPGANYSMMLIHLQPHRAGWLKIDDVYGKDIKNMLSWV